MPPTPQQKKIASLEAILKAFVEDYMTKEEVENFLKTVVSHVKNIESRTERELRDIVASVKKSLVDIQSQADNKTDLSRKELEKKIEEMLNPLILEIESLKGEAQAKIDEVRDGENGMDADEEAIVGKVLGLIPPPPVQTAEGTRDLLETLSGPERLKIEAIDKLREELDRLEKEIRKDRTVIGGSRGVGILDEGVTVDPNAHWLNFTGAGVSISTVGNQTVISITGGGAGSSTPAQESGTIIDLTTIVTLGNTPVADTLMLYINEAFVDPSRYTVNGSDAIVMNSALDGSYTGLRYTAIYQY